MCSHVKPPKKTILMKTKRLPRGKVVKLTESETLILCDKIKRETTTMDWSNTIRHIKVKQYVINDRLLKVYEIDLGATGHYNRCFEPIRVYLEYDDGCFFKSYFTYGESAYKNFIARILNSTSDNVLLYEYGEAPKCHRREMYNDFLTAIFNKKVN